MSIDFGGLKIDPIELGSQGNAILGIRDSGKSYTATFLAERLFEADIPFIAFDPIGIWRFLRVPGQQRGGNSRLGYTLINHRSQEVAKAILELCENIFLHRQRGKNALENLDKWLSVAGAEERLAILKSLPDLPQGDSWAWIGGDKPRPPA